MLQAIRLIGFAVLAAVAVAAYVALAPRVARDQPTLPSATQYESLISQALADFELNDIGADSAPQQAVVNGWIARDLLTIIAKELADVLRAQGAIVDATGNLQTQPFDERIPALLLIGVLAITWGQLTTGLRARPREPEPMPDTWSARQSV